MVLDLCENRFLFEAMELRTVLPDRERLHGIVLVGHARELGRLRWRAAGCVIYVRIRF